MLRDKGYRVPYLRPETSAPVEPTGQKDDAATGRAHDDYDNVQS